MKYGPNVIRWRLQAVRDQSPPRGCAACPSLARGAVCCPGAKQVSVTPRPPTPSPQSSSCFSSETPSPGVCSFPCRDGLQHQTPRPALSPKPPVPPFALLPASTLQRRKAPTGGRGGGRYDSVDHQSSRNVKEKKMAQASSRPREALAFPRQRLGGAVSPGLVSSSSQTQGGESRRGLSQAGSSGHSERPAPAAAWSGCGGQGLAGRCGTGR